MLNLVSVIIGVIALILAVPAFFPFLAWLYWLIIPLALIGAAVGIGAQNKTGRNLNLFVIVIGVIRLSIGGGFI